MTDPTAKISALEAKRNTVEAELADLKKQLTRAHSEAMHLAMLGLITATETNLAAINNQITAFANCLAPPPPPPAVSTLESLLVKAGFRPRAEVCDRASFNYPSAVLLCTQTGNVDLARKTYEMASMLPSAHTMQVLKASNIKVCGKLFEHSNLLICHDIRGLPFVLKPIERSHYLRVKDLAEEMTRRNITEIPCVTAFRVFNSNEISGIDTVSGIDKTFKNYSMMPMFSLTLEQIQGVDEQTVSQYWRDLSQGLDVLHNLGFAHMDVKPANIALTQDGVAVFIDIESTAKFGETTSSTVAYIPYDLRERVTTAKELVDWGMLTATLCEKFCGKHGIDFGSGTPKTMTLDTMVQHLDQYLMDERQPDGSGGRSSLVVHELQERIRSCRQRSAIRPQIPTTPPPRPPAKRGGEVVVLAPPTRRREGRIKVDVTGGPTDETANMSLIGH